MGRILFPKIAYVLPGCTREDVRPYEYYISAVAWAYDKGIANGLVDCADGSVGNIVERKGFVMMPWRLAGIS